MHLIHRLLLLLLPAAQIGFAFGGWTRSSAANPASGARLDAVSLDSTDVHSSLSSLSARYGSPEIPMTSSSNPSCFHRAISSLPATSPCQALAHSDSARVEMAVSMAICELETAGGGSGKIPRECVDWQGGSGKVTSCVEALARSPQQWSSYSGYLREVVTICSTFRRWSDLEQARDLHASASASFADFLQMLKTHEDVRQKRDSEDWSHRRQHESSLTDLLRDLDRMKATLTADLENQTRQLRVTDVALKASVYDMDELSLSLAAGVASAVSNLEQAVQRSSVSLSRSLLEAQSSHELALQSASDRLRHELNSTTMEVVFATREVSRSLVSLSDSVSSNQLALDRANVMSGELLHALQANLVVASELHATQLQQSATHKLQAHQLSEVLHNLTALAERRPTMGHIDLSDIGWWIDLAWSLGTQHWLALLLAALVASGSFGVSVSRLFTFLSVTVGLVRMVSSLFAVAHDLGKLIPRRTTSSSGLFPTSPSNPLYLELPPPTPRSRAALASSSFILSHPPSSARAGIGSPERFSRFDAGQ